MLRQSLDFGIERLRADDSKNYLAKMNRLKTDPVLQFNWADEQPYSLWRLFFSDSAVYSLADFDRENGRLNTVTSTWSLINGDDDGDVDADAKAKLIHATSMAQSEYKQENFKHNVKLKRDYMYTLPLTGPFVPPTTRCYKTQQVTVFMTNSESAQRFRNQYAAKPPSPSSHDDDNNDDDDDDDDDDDNDIFGFVVDTQVLTPDVPLGSTFFVADRVVCSRALTSTTLLSNVSIYIDVYYTNGPPPPPSPSPSPSSSSSPSPAPAPSSFLSSLSSSFTTLSSVSALQVLPFRRIIESRSRNEGQQAWTTWMQAAKKHATKNKKQKQKKQKKQQQKQMKKDKSKNDNSSENSSSSDSIGSSSSNSSSSSGGAGAVKERAEEKADTMESLNTADTVRHNDDKNNLPRVRAVIHRSSCIHPCSIDLSQLSSHCHRTSSLHRAQAVYEKLESFATNEVVNITISVSMAILSLYVLFGI